MEVVHEMPPKPAQKVPLKSPLPQRGARPSSTKNSSAIFKIQFEKGKDYKMHQGGALTSRGPPTSHTNEKLNKDLSLSPPHGTATKKITTSPASRGRNQHTTGRKAK